MCKQIINHIYAQLLLKMMKNSILPRLYFLMVSIWVSVNIPDKTEKIIITFLGKKIEINVKWKQNRKKSFSSYVL